MRWGIQKCAMLRILPYEINLTYILKVLPTSILKYLTIFIFTFPDTPIDSTTSKLCFCEPKRHAAPYPWRKT